jgi:hypothetical protein
MVPCPAWFRLLAAALTTAPLLTARAPGAMGTTRPPVRRDSLRRPVRPTARPYRRRRSGSVPVLTIPSSSAGLDRVANRSASSFKFRFRA